MQQKRAKLCFEVEQLHEAMNLPEGVNIIAMFVEYNPKRLFVVLNGDRFEEIDRFAESPITNLQDIWRLYQDG